MRPSNWQLAWMRARSEPGRHPRPDEASREQAETIGLAGDWYAGTKGEAVELAAPDRRTMGELQRFDDHYSLSLDGLSPEQVRRIMGALRGDK